MKKWRGRAHEESAVVARALPAQSRLPCAFSRNSRRRRQFWTAVAIPQSGSDTALPPGFSYFQSVTGWRQSRSLANPFFF